VLRQRQERALEVPVGNKYNDVSSWMGSEREDTRNGSFHSSKCAVVTSAEPALDAGAIGEREEGDDEVVRVWDWVNVDGVVVCRGLVCEVDDGCRTRRRCWGIKSAEDLGVGPCETCRDAEDREGGGEEGGEGSGNVIGVKTSRIEGGQST